MGCVLSGISMLGSLIRVVLTSRPLQLEPNEQTDRQTDRQTDCFIVINTLHVHSQNFKIQTSPSQQCCYKTSGLGLECQNQIVCHCQSLYLIVSRASLKQLWHYISEG